MKNLPQKPRKGRKVIIPKVILKLDDSSPEERLQALDDIYDILFEETLKVFDFKKATSCCK